MDNLTYTLRQIYQRNRDGSYGMLNGRRMAGTAKDGAQRVKADLLSQTMQRPYVTQGQDGLEQDLRRLCARRRFALGA